MVTRNNQGLFLEWKPAGSSAFHSYQHAYIVYRDGKGGEYVVRGGPGDGLAATKFTVGGQIEVESGIPLSESKDAYETADTPKLRNSIKLDVGQRDPADVFKAMKERADEIAKQGIDYNLMTEDGPMQNSNSLVRSVMEAADVPVPSGLPLEKLPGFENDLSRPQDGFGRDAHHRRPDEEYVPEHQRDTDLEKANPGGGKPIDGAETPSNSEIAENASLKGEQGADVLRGGSASDTLSTQQQLIDAFTADDGQSDVLYKRTEDITEDEIEGVMKSDTYWESNDPDYLAAKEKVNAFYDLNYGTDPVERDATGRMIDSGPKRKIPTEAT
ncbi:MAG: hypothetical protein ACPGOV_16165, partial [Magnetovibrionaceae bacterium]